MESHYDYLTARCAEEFVTEKVLHETERGAVTLLRHRQSGRRYVFRRFQGSRSVYARLSGVRTPHLPRVYDTAEKDGNVAVLEEYVQGDTLQELLKGGLFTPRETRQVARDICRGLWVLHSLGAVHRDVKPENVILRDSGAVLIDFDASRVYKALQETDTQVLGTMGYAAPEQFGLSQTDRRADIYSLGVLMNVMVTGAFPFTKPAKGRLGKIIQKCTMATPEKRYADVLQLMEALSL